ncbi:lycopene cyclase domain-containing protein [Halopolyspora algeriensis]|uniref:Lycopene cyclase domain-containing protein n=1 Tax=Halopolyspora algeriensis TaxID=1500506 RepID=A0A368W2G8_9ACTN|nr:lycopene cyclase domain-containing protein [Halopolyspora algeriensis]RCW46168.1 lycopene cyclase domain-containing protein [Halopolyspora algeriensis]TQM55571.1 lycopene cyclase domain-containing protein [Halopolyspora algeriensis]
MDRFQYLLLMAGCLAITLPLEILGARVYRRPGRLVRTLLPVLGVFLVWDVVAIARGHWTFHPDYVTGWSLPGGLPIEELAFFVVIPICGLLTYESVDRMLTALRRPADAGEDLLDSPGKR